MARKKRLDSKGYTLRTGESQDKDGRYCYKWMEGDSRLTVRANSLKELREKERDIQRRIDSGIDTSKRNLTLNELFDLYMSTRNDIRDVTAINYTGLWNRSVRETFGMRKVADIEAFHVRRFYTDLQKNDGLSWSTIKIVHGMLRPCFQLAVESHIILSNPTINTFSVVKKDVKQREALTQGQQETLLQFVKESPVYNQWYPMILFDLCTALRVGELTGLRWSNIDADGAHIEQQLVYKNIGEGCQFYLTELKTDAACRTIPLTRTARKALLLQKEADFKQGKNGKRQEIAGADDYCFVNKNGMPFSVTAVNLALKNIVSAYNKKETMKAEMQNREPILLPHISAHILRHTACTRLAESGIEAKVLQMLMGHTDISITLNVYTHLSDEHIRESIEAIQDKVKFG